jgi:hypothetical protein
MIPFVITSFKRSLLMTQYLRGTRIFDICALTAMNPPGRTARQVRRPQCINQSVIQVLIAVRIVLWRTLITGALCIVVAAVVATWENIRNIKVGKYITNVASCFYCRYSNRVGDGHDDGNDTDILDQMLTDIHGVNVVVITKRTMIRA